jgi:DNA-binding response OmpR family regulator
MGQSKIVIIDNDEISSRFIGSHLEANNYLVLLAENGKDYLSFIEKELPDLILLDMTLPHAESFRICRKVREWSEIPIIMLSERNNNLNELRSLDIGADDFIIKPFSIEILSFKVKAILRRAEKNKTGFQSRTGLNCALFDTI